MKRTRLCLLLLAAIALGSACGDERGGDEQDPLADPDWVAIAGCVGNADGVVSGEFIARLLSFHRIPIRGGGGLSHTFSVPAALAGKAEDLVHDSDGLRPYLSMPRLALSATARSRPVDVTIIDLPYAVALERVSDPVVIHALTGRKVAHWASNGKLGFVHSVAVSGRPFVSRDLKPTKAHIVHIRFCGSDAPLPDAPLDPTSWLLTEVPVFPD